MHGKPFVAGPGLGSRMARRLSDYSCSGRWQQSWLAFGSDVQSDSSSEKGLALASSADGRLCGFGVGEIVAPRPLSA